MPTFVVGDLQGCHERLLALLENIKKTSVGSGLDGNRFIFVGDLVNRGPGSLATLREIHALGNTSNTVLGNHDLNLLAVAIGVRQAQPGDTLSDILAAPDRDELLDWLRHRPLAIEHAGHLVVHAGVLAGWSLEKTLELAREVEVVLQGPSWPELLANMYGKEPTAWDDRLRGWDRLRCIVNALTRMRYCHPDGSMDFSSDKQPSADRLPWFEVAGRLTADTSIVFGHWSALGLTMRKHLMGIDSGCLWGGQLTAVRLEDRALFQVDCPQFKVPGLGGNE
jgi:bis(5'-nucleosyl)-tetraphosphatase (symmetrical)